MFDGIRPLAPLAAFAAAAIPPPLSIGIIPPLFLESTDCFRIFSSVLTSPVKTPCGSLSLEISLSPRRMSEKAASSLTFARFDGPSPLNSSDFIRFCIQDLKTSYSSLDDGCLPLRISLIIKLSISPGAVLLRRSAEPEPGFSTTERCQLPNISFNASFSKEDVNLIFLAFHTFSSIPLEPICVSLLMCADAIVLALLDFKTLFSASIRPAILAISFSKSFSFMPNDPTFSGKS